ncbi:MAG: hypothetical protein WC471_04455 [Candidatus Woesearchaeota archaeon]|jgi:hypothetical protein
MGEEYVVVEGVTVSYSGLFKAKDLLTEINEILTKKNYDKEEKSNTEKVTAKGKNIELKMEYGKRQSSYIKYVIEVELKIKEMKDTVVTKGDRKIKYNEGDIEIEFKSKLKTDLAGKWKSRPDLVFIGHVINKYLYPIYISKEISELKEHTMYVKDSVKAFLNLYKF